MLPDVLPGEAEGEAEEAVLLPGALLLEEVLPGMAVILLLPEVLPFTFRALPPLVVQAPFAAKV